MITNKTIKFISGVFLMLAFALGNTPTRILHHLFANHHDTVQTQTGKGTQITNAALNCHCDTTVFTNPFIVVKTAAAPVPIFWVDQIYSDPNIQQPQFSISGRYLRGPPLV